MSQAANPFTAPDYAQFAAIGVHAVLLRDALGGAFALLLFGCASVTSFDESALAAADTTRSRAIEECRKRGTGGEFRTIAAYFDCELVADREFAVAIRLTPMRAFDSYEDRVKRLAIGADSGKAQINQILASRRSMEAEFWRSVMGGIFPKGIGLSFQEWGGTRCMTTYFVQTNLS